MSCGLHATAVFWPLGKASDKNSPERACGSRMMRESGFRVVWQSVCTKVRPPLRCILRCSVALHSVGGP